MNTAQERVIAWNPFEDLEWMNYDMQILALQSMGYTPNQDKKSSTFMSFRSSSEGEILLIKGRGVMKFGNHFIADEIHPILTPQGIPMGFGIKLKGRYYLYSSHSNMTVVGHVDQILNLKENDYGFEGYDKLMDGIHLAFGLAGNARRI